MSDRMVEIVGYSIIILGGAGITWAACLIGRAMAVSLAAL